MLSTIRILRLSHYWQTSKIKYIFKRIVCIFKEKQLIKPYPFFLQITQNAASTCIGWRSWAKRCRYAKNQSLTKIPRVHFFGWIRFLAQLVFCLPRRPPSRPPARPLFHSTARNITTWRALVRRRQDDRFILVMIIAKTHRTVFVVVSTTTVGQKTEKNVFLSRVTIVCHNHQD